MNDRLGQLRQIAGVVVLYNPALWVVANIRSYLDQVGELFVVDNSERSAPEVVSQLALMPRLTYLANGSNLGVARALNIGAERAVAAGYCRLLTMDQDSSAMPGMVAALLSCLDGEAGNAVGLAAPFLATWKDERPPESPACQPVLTAMTSGSLLDLRAYQKAGPFADELFIDFVDIEYCLRLQRTGFKVLRANCAILKHNVGSKIALPGGFAVTSHDAIRKYYKTRNRICVWERYWTDFPAYCLRDAVRFFLELARLFLFEPERVAKTRMMARGIDHACRGKMGKYVV